MILNGENIDLKPSNCKPWSFMVILYQSRVPTERVRCFAILDNATSTKKWGTLLWNMTRGGATGGGGILPYGFQKREKIEDYGYFHV